MKNSGDGQFRINDQIRVPEIRLVGDDFDEISKAAGETIIAGVYPTRYVLAWAEDLGIDLVEITPNAAPPVCKIIDYKKFLYQKKVKEKEMKANAVKTIIKEIRFGPETAEHDFEFKLRHAKTFLQEGATVKAYVQFRGRAIVFKERGEQLLARFVMELEEFGQPESTLRLEGKRIMVNIRPKKGASKK
ncbi:MAG: translation initiation factor IF-3 [Saprospiraceae bacterium]|nr:translation initiation factor IF-3 [Saprospiraceae bacterium]MBP7699458.1 translation initiation factor IF-3 [Saprospiraceae bacterium]